MSGRVWVIANGKGVSTWEVKDAGWQKPWRLPKGTVHSSHLIVWNDQPGHWVWEPAMDMLLIDYEQALAPVNALFIKA